MWGRLATKLVVWLLRNGRLSNENRQLLTAELLDRLGALPLHASIRIDELGNWFVRGRPLTLERAHKLHQGAKAMLKNYTRTFVQEQVRFMAIQKGVHENVSPEQGLFAKAALWAMQEEQALYLSLGQDEPEDR